MCLRLIEMRIMVYGRERTVQKMMTVLAEEGIDGAGVSDELYELLGWPTERPFDLAIVDSQAESTEDTCNRIREYWGIPFVLMVDKALTNWDELQGLDADGYLSARAEGREMVARIRALLRSLGPFSES